MASPPGAPAMVAVPARARVPPASSVMAVVRLSTGPRPVMLSAISGRFSILSRFATMPLGGSVSVTARSTVLSALLKTISALSLPPGPSRRVMFSAESSEPPSSRSRPSSETSEPRPNTPSPNVTEGTDSLSSWIATGNSGICNGCASGAGRLGSPLGMALRTYSILSALSSRTSSRPPNSAPWSQSMAALLMRSQTPSLSEIVTSRTEAWLERMPSRLESRICRSGSRAALRRTARTSRAAARAIAGPARRAAPPSPVRRPRRLWLLSRRIRRPARCRYRGRSRDRPRCLLIGMAISARSGPRLV